MFLLLQKGTSNQQGGGDGGCRKAAGLQRKDEKKHNTDWGEGGSEKEK